MAISEIIPNKLYVGNRNDAGHLVFSNPFAITTVLNLAVEEDWPRDAEVNYVHHPIEDDDEIAPEFFEQVLKLMARELEHGRVLLHCVAGFSRAPVVAAAFLARSENLSFEAALDRIRELRPVTSPSLVTIRAAKQFMQTNHTERGGAVISKDNFGNISSEMNAMVKQDGTVIQTSTSYYNGKVTFQTITTRTPQGQVNVETVRGGKLLP